MLTLKVEKIEAAARRAFIADVVYRSSEQDPETSPGPVLWADRNAALLAPDTDARDAWCDKCCDTAALLTIHGEWHCGSCGAPIVPTVADE